MSIVLASTRYLNYLEADAVDPAAVVYGSNLDRLRELKTKWDGVMADTKVRAATLDQIGDLVEDMAGVHLRNLPPLTTLLVWTKNSLYRVVITRWPEVCVQGGAFFPDPTSAYLDGASIGGNCLRVGWIGVGFVVEIRSGGRHIITSPVVAITTEQASSLVEH